MAVPSIGADAAVAPTVEFVVEEQSALENAGVVHVTLQLSAAHTTDIDVPFTLGGDALQGADYTVVASPVTIPAGATTFDLDVTLLDDGSYELDETVVLSLGTPTNATLGVQTIHTLTVQDDDPLPTAGFRTAGAVKKESFGVVRLDVDLSAVSGVDASLAYSVTGTALDGADYTIAPSPLLIPAGALSASVDVTLIDDVFPEPLETVIVRLESAAGALLGPSVQSMVVIVPSDLPFGGKQRPGSIGLPLTMSPQSMDFGPVRLGSTSAEKTLTVGNFSTMNVDLTGSALRGLFSGDFALNVPVTLPHTLQPGDVLDIGVTFTPSAHGTRTAIAGLAQSPFTVVRLNCNLRGTGIGLPGSEILVNAGGAAYTSVAGDDFVADYGHLNQGTVYSITSGQILGTADDPLYWKARVGVALSYDFELPNGPYDVTLHFSETRHLAAGLRVFDVSLEGALVEDDLDLFATVGQMTAHVVTHRVDLTDGSLDLDFASTVGKALISAVEIRSVGQVAPEFPVLDLGFLSIGQSQSLPIAFTNVGGNVAHASQLHVRVTGGDGSDFTFDFGGNVYAGDSQNITYPIDVTWQGGEVIVAQVTYTPLEHDFNDLEFALDVDGQGEVAVQVLGVAGIGGDPYLHPVPIVEPYVVDYDGDLSEPVLLDGTDSHTHEPGRVLTNWEWREGTTLVSSQMVDTVTFGLGQHTLDLEIRDDNSPQRSSSDSVEFAVVPTSEVPGVLALYYAANPPTTSASSFLDAVPTNPDFAALQYDLAVGDEGGIGDSGLQGDTLVRLLARFDVPAAGTWAFQVTGGVGHRIEVDGAPLTGPLALNPGTHDLEVRWAVDTLADLPLGVTYTIDAGAPQTFPFGSLRHSETAQLPVINTMPVEGITTGGNQISISGFGFFPSGSVTVHWGGMQLTSFIEQSPTTIEFLSPAMPAGTITVQVETPAGLSDVHTFEYKTNGPVPIMFVNGPKLTMFQPTASEWGPDGRLWITARDGTLRAATLDANYNFTAVDLYNGVSGLSNHEILGIAFSPYDDDALNPVVYVAHSEMFAQGGASFPGASPYTGQVSKLVGPNFDTPIPVVTKLPTSNHDHAVNGMEFDNNGDLLLCIGSNTNAGVRYWRIGDLDESPLTAAIVKIELTRPNFDGALEYIETGTSTINNDQVFGGIVDVAPLKHVTPFATGLRNPFDLVFTTWGDVYATDNGPNDTYGVASLTATTQTTWHPDVADEFMRVEYGHYYGHPNRNRGRRVAIENTYLDPSAPARPGFTQQLATLPSSSNGLVEYRASTFSNQMRGDLITMKWGGKASQIKLTADKKAVTAITQLPPSTFGLNVQVGPGGALISMDYQGNKVRTFRPNDQSVSGVTVYDIFPWRAPADGGARFVIGGENFGTLANTTVTIGGLPATLTSVTARRIVGVVPANASPTTNLEDVVVTVSGSAVNLPGAFLFLPPTIGSWKGWWTTHTDMPYAAGEVATGVINGVLYVVGESTNRTQGYDIASDTWAVNLAQRSFKGHHHASEVYNGKWYLIGGLAGGSEGKVQIYDPVADTWSAGANMPWAGGSVSTALIGGKIYASGGIVGSTTVDDCAVYDIATNTWTTLASMPAGKGRNHAASGTDGQRFWIFGGRGVGSGAGNVVANGFDDVHVYDPATDTWDASYLGGNLSVLPIGRGGTGKAVFYQGRFYVFGGETLNGQGAEPGNVYSRVDVYDPQTDTWTLEAKMPTARHGIAPVAWQGRIWVVGGGTNAGFSKSKVFESFAK